MATTFPIRATVIEFDRSVGLGRVRTTAGDDAVEGVEHPFHATALSDGTRDIAIGTDVVCKLAAGHCGTIEASEIVPLASDEPLT